MGSGIGAWAGLAVRERVAARAPAGAGGGERVELAPPTFPRFDDDA